MSPNAEQSVEAFLQETLSDRKLSRGERRALTQAVAGKLGHQQLDLLKHRVFEIAEHQLNDPGSKAILHWVEDIIKVLHADGGAVEAARNEAFFSGDDDCTARICNLLGMCESSLEICVFTITDDRISNSIVAAHRRGIEVRIITDNDKASDLGSDISDMRRMRINIITDESAGHMHNKYAIFDRRKLLTGSFNWTRSASLNNDENILISDDRGLVASFAAHFEKLWKRYSK